jgi:DNA repair photolyase
VTTDAPIEVEEVACKSALTGSGGHFRLNPYVGCEHACVYCYATYIARWRGKAGPWGTWVQAKTNAPEVLVKELRRKSRRGIEIMLSTVCDVYQPVERDLGLTRRCLSALVEAAHDDRDLRVFLLTKSDLVLRDLDLLEAFPEGRLRVSFSVTTRRDDVAALLEPRAASPSARFAAARALVEAGLPVGILINPVLPYVTERDLPHLLDRIEAAGVTSVSFDMLHYLREHVGGKMQPAYVRLGRAAQARLKQARDDPAYEDEVRQVMQRAIEGRKLGG